MVLEIDDCLIDELWSVCCMLSCEKHRVYWTKYNTGEHTISEYIDWQRFHSLSDLLWDYRCKVIPPTGLAGA